MNVSRTSKIATALAIALAVLTSGCASNELEPTTQHATVSLVVQDVDRSIEFYRLLGLTIPDDTIYREGDAGWGARFAVVIDPDGHLVGIMGPTA